MTEEKLKQAEAHCADLKEWQSNKDQIPPYDLLCGLIDLVPELISEVRQLNRLLAEKNETANVFMKKVKKLQKPLAEQLEPTIAVLLLCHKTIGWKDERTRILKEIDRLHALTGREK